MHDVDPLRDLREGVDQGEERERVYQSVPRDTFFNFILCTLSMMICSLTSVLVVIMFMLSHDSTARHGKLLLGLHGVAMSDTSDWTSQPGLH